MKQIRKPWIRKIWVRKLWYTYTMVYYSAIKKNTFESAVMRWMKLEPIIQSEVSQKEKKEKHQHSILTHIYMGFRKMVTITLYARQQKRHRCTEQSFGLCGEKARVGWFERIALKHVYHHMWNRSPVQVRCMRQGAQGWCTGMTQKDGMGREMGGGSGWGTHVHPWWIHVNIWQNHYNNVN